MAPAGVREVAPMHGQLNTELMFKMSENITVETREYQADTVEGAETAVSSF